MTATLLPQLADRKNEVERGELSGLALDAEVTRLKVLVDGLAEKVKALPEDDTRSKYLDTVNKAFADLKSAKPKKEKTEEKVEPVKVPEPKVEPEPVVEPVKEEVPPVKAAKK